MNMALTNDAWQTVNGRNPAKVNTPWSRLMIALLCLTALVTPIACFAAAPVAFANSDQDDGFLLASVGGAHILITWALFGTISII